ncbi:MAG: tRNA (adenosine(37)-N6)-dimethylallyltransferase MiaA [Spongiibacteraceae bacterium]
MSNSTLPPAICLMGPTASGKTALALALSCHFPCEIISVDSALIYRGMDIGTAKPTLAERAQVPHHLIDIRDPSEVYSAAEFRADALRLMDEITSRGRIPLLVGGTLLYFKVLKDGLASMPAANADVRSQIEVDARIRGWPALHAELAAIDPQSAARIHPQHSQRIQRALEVYRVSGESMSVLHARQSAVEPSHRLIELAVAPLDRAVLHQRIAARFARMLQDGFLDEVRALRDRGDLHVDLPSIRAVGYRQAWDYLNDVIDFETLRERGVIATRQLAKRQFTWLRGWADLRWFWTDIEQRAINENTATEDLLETVLKYVEPTLT